jgi:uncharacterized SAM-binding protein YcdF (DUF218 family)
MNFNVPLAKRIAIAAVVVLIAASAVIAFRNAGRWLVREDPIAPADVIVVLSGGIPYRAEGAADLYRQKYAPEVWITRPEGPEQQLSEMGIRFVGEEEYSREVLMHEGVPAGAIVLLPGEIINTEEEIDEIVGDMRNRSKSRAIIVTGPPHTRRVRALWSRLAARDQLAIVEAAREDPFDRDHWWHNTRDTYVVVREFMGLINAWVGLTVRPHSPRANARH